MHQCDGSYRTVKFIIYVLLVRFEGRGMILMLKSVTIVYVNLIHRRVSTY